ncbi:MOSC domain-containing protein [Paraconexibacter sp.]|uniref:MOSC domain-containing protein n=1 Tax=Paraconexibacter sp. TaxID=2949640 RepID=UPI00356ABD91
MLRGRVVSLHRWPVKSLGGEDVRALVVDDRGAAGDRTHALFDTHQGAARRLTARQAPRMLLWTARYPEVADEAVDLDAPPLPVLTSPDGATSLRWDDPSLPAVLGEDLGRRVSLRRDVRGQQDLGRSLLITSTATHAAVEESLGALDLRRWRTNVHVEFEPGVAPYAEELWEHGHVEIGEVGLDLLHPCLRCVIPTRDPDAATKQPEILRWLTRRRAGMFGINARPVSAGVIRVGDVVTVTPPGS